MSWRSLTLGNVISEGAFTSAEQSQLDAAAGSAAFSDVIDAQIYRLRGIVQAAGGAVPVDTTEVPDSFRPDLIAIIRWTWLTAFPSLTKLQTDARKAAWELAEKRLDAIATGDRSVESTGTSDWSGAGNYGTETKVAMRTSDGGHTSEDD
jgi:hypothetical protein